VNLSTVAELIARSALMRQESRGAHYRRDFPEKDVAWLKNICCQREEAGVKFWTTPVKFTRLAPPELTDAQRPVSV
jgi:succinate dehydrogenase/fumarate reductase flavoprotein subunit